MLGISKNMTRLRQLYEMRKSLLDNTSFISEDQKQEFMDLIKEIDSVEQKDYLVLLATKTYNTTSNANELNRLKELVELIDERYKSRLEMNQDFKRIFKSDIEFADDIKEYDKVDIYRQKITYLESITNNEHAIDDNKKLISDLSVELSKEYEHKKENNRVNKKLEEELLNKITIKTNLAGNNAYDLVSVIDMELSKFKLKMNDLLESNSLLKEKMGTAKEESSKAKEKYHTALISYNANKEYGGNILENYRVLGEIKKEYYTCRYYEILLGICALVIPLKESDYDNLIGKRYRLIKLLDERKSLRNELEIRTYDRLSNLYNEVNEQCKKLLEQGNNIDNIDDIEHRIAVLTSQIDDLERDNQELLENVKKLDNDLTSEKTKVKVNMRPENNMVIAIENVPRQMNLDIVNFKTRSVLAKVYELLNNKTKEKEVSKPVEELNDTPKEPIIPKFDLPIIDDEKLIDDDKEPVVEDNVSLDIPKVEDSSEIVSNDDNYVNPEITIEEVEKEKPVEEPVSIIKEEPVLTEEDDIFEDDDTPILKDDDEPVILSGLDDLNEDKEIDNADLFINDNDEDNLDVGMIFPNDNKLDDKPTDDNLFWPQIEMPEIKKPEEPKIDLEKTQELSLDEQVERFLKSSD